LPFYCMSQDLILDSAGFMNSIYAKLEPVDSFEFNFYYDCTTNCTECAFGPAVLNKDGTCVRLTQSYLLNNVTPTEFTFDARIHVSAAWPSFAAPGVLMIVLSFFSIL
jgi:hypothetical protein